MNNLGFLDDGGVVSTPVRFESGSEELVSTGTPIFTEKSKTEYQISAELKLSLSHFHKKEKKNLSLTICSVQVFQTSGIG